MIKIDNIDVYGWEAAIRGMRNPKNSWNKSDSDFEFGIATEVGENDLALMSTLANAGDDHGKFLRMITVTMDITAPLYFWKEFDTYKVGTVSDSCSTMHKIGEKEFEPDDFSHEHLFFDSIGVLDSIIDTLNKYRNAYNRSDDPDEKKMCWWQLIQLLPSSYNQKRTIQLNYQVLRHMYNARKNHKLDEWRTFCKWINVLPYAKELIIF